MQLRTAGSKPGITGWQINGYRRGRHPAQDQKRAGQIHRQWVWFDLILFITVPAVLPVGSPASGRRLL